METHKKKVMKEKALKEKLQHTSPMLISFTKIENNKANDTDLWIQFDFSNKFILSTNERGGKNRTQITKNSGNGSGGGGNKIKCKKSICCLWQTNTNSGRKNNSN